ncbi:uncharacterized protein LOC142793055 [Rhipicephalus microplus]|uniref:uncharacterized protein LOC142793055 n=1 Tax=Rhipicephalus microplus TaxID=6941 RepID=UPI003F6B4212
MPRKLLVGGLQRNGTLRSSTIKKVAPPVVPDSGSAASTGRRHSSSSACTTPVLHSPPLYGSSSEEPPPSPTAYDGADQKTFSPAEVFSEAEMAPLSRPQSHPGTPVGMPTTPLPPGLPPVGNRGVCYLAGSLDDTGVTGNPGRDSPSGGSVESRHSSSSLDSGRGSSSSSSADSKVAHRLSTGSHGSSSSLTLTSSVGSHMSSLTPEVVVLSPLNVAGLLVNGVSVSERHLTIWGVLLAPLPTSAGLVYSDGLGAIARRYWCALVGTPEQCVVFRCGPQPGVVADFLDGFPHIQPSDKRIEKFQLRVTIQARNWLFINISVVMAFVRCFNVYNLPPAENYPDEIGSFFGMP